MTDEEHKYIVKLRRKINTIMRLTKKAKMPDCIKIEYGSRDAHDVHITDTDKLNIPRRAGIVYIITYNWIHKIEKLFQVVSPIISAMTRQNLISHQW